jgi:hypothetical protein
LGFQIKYGRTFTYETGKCFLWADLGDSVLLLVVNIPISILRANMSHHSR